MEEAEEIKVKRRFWNARKRSEVRREGGSPCQFLVTLPCLEKLNKWRSTQLNVFTINLSTIPIVRRYLRSLDQFSIRTRLAAVLATLAKVGVACLSLRDLAGGDGESVTVRSLISWSAIISLVVVNSYFKTDNWRRRSAFLFSVEQPHLACRTPAYTVIACPPCLKLGKNQCYSREPPQSTRLSTV